MDKDKIIELINAYCKFDNNQEHTSTWHDKQDLISAIKQALIIADVSQQRELLLDFIWWHDLHGGFELDSTAHEELIDTYQKSKNSG